MARGGMQFTEYSVFGLRSARHRLESPDHPAQVVLYPVVHVGTPDFYARIEEEARAADVVIVEGVDSPIVRRLVRSYRWIRPGRFGLVVQPAFDPGESDARVRAGDLSPEAFEALWGEGPRFGRWALELGAAVFGLYHRVFGTRESIARAAVTDDLPGRNDLLSWSPETAWMTRALIEARDARVCAVIEDELGPRDGTPRTVAVIYGAAPMPAIVSDLRSVADFRPVDSEWIEVILA